MSRAGSAIAALALALPLVACASQAQTSGSTVPAASASASTRDSAVLSGRTLTPATVASSPAARGTAGAIVIAISVDGLNPTALRQLGSAVPNYNRLVQEGASTLNARAAYELTDTLHDDGPIHRGRRWPQGDLQ